MNESATPEAKLSLSVMSQQTAFWTVRGANWTWKSIAPVDKSPLEIATRALESFWNKSVGDLSDPTEAWKGKPTFDLRVNDGRAPAVGTKLQVWHGTMEIGQDQNTFVCAITALANAGFHHDAKRLKKSCEDDQNKGT